MVTKMRVMQVLSVPHKKHYEIATYGSLRAWARILGETDIANTLNELLDQEYEADDKLSKIAETWLNEKAMS